MKRSRLFLASCAVVIFGLGAMPLVAHAAPGSSSDSSSTTTTDSTAKSSVCQALDAGADCKHTTQGTVDLNTVITTIVNIFSFVVGVVAVIMIIVAGYRFVTSGGDSSKVSTARSTITYALIGIVVVAMAQGIVRLVLNNIFPHK